MENAGRFACAPLVFVVDVEAELLVEDDEVFRVGGGHRDVVYADSCHVDVLPVSGECALALGYNGLRDRATGDRANTSSLFF